MSPVSVRYIAGDVGSATAFYRDNFGFTVEMSPAPGFAMLSRGELRLLLNAPGSGGAGEAMPECSQSAPPAVSPESGLQALRQSVAKPRTIWYSRAREPERQFYRASV